MEEEEAPTRSRRAHRFVPAKRTDTVKSTGYPKYLPIKTYENDGVDYGTIVKTDAAMDTGRKRRGVFTNANMVMGALHSLSKVEEIDVAEYMDRKKRSGFTNGLLKARVKLLDGSPGGLFVEMLKPLGRRTS